MADDDDDNTKATQKMFKERDGEGVLKKLVKGSDKLKGFKFDVGDALTNAPPRDSILGPRNFYTAVYGAEGEDAAQFRKDIRIYLHNAGIALGDLPARDVHHAVETGRMHRLEERALGVIYLDKDRYSAPHLENFGKGVNQAPAALQYAQYEFLNTVSQAHGMRFTYDSAQKKFVSEPAIVGGAQGKIDGEEFALFSKRLQEAYKAAGKPDALAIDKGKKQITLDPAGLEKGGYVKFSRAYAKARDADILTHLKDTTHCEWTVENGKAVCDKQLSDYKASAVADILVAASNLKKGEKFPAEDIAIANAGVSLNRSDLEQNTLMFDIPNISSARWRKELETGKERLQDILDTKPKKPAPEQQKAPETHGMESLVPHELKAALERSVEMPGQQAAAGGPGKPAKPKTL